MESTETVTYTKDDEIDAMYIHLIKDLKGVVGSSKETVQVPGKAIYLDFDKDGRLKGIEILSEKHRPW